MLINNSIRERAENRGSELGQQVRSNGSQLFESCPWNRESFISSRPSIFRALILRLAMLFNVEGVEILLKIVLNNETESNVSINLPEHSR